MPEHDLFDLDAAFSALERDVSTLSSAPGAGLAVARARRRRRTTVGAVAAVAVLLVGGAVVGHGLGQDRAVEPAGRLPAPASLTAERLTSATEGWTPAWQADTQAAQQKMALTFGGDCFPSFSGGQADGFTLFGNSHDDLAITTTADFTGDPSGEPVVWQRMVRSMDACKGAEQVSTFSGAAGVAARTYQVAASASESASEYIWIASTDQGIGVLKILGQSDPLPSSNDTAVTDALVAAVEQRGVTSTPQTNGSAQRIDPTQEAGTVWAQALEPALTGWSSRWNPRLPQDASEAVPVSLPDCAGTPEGNDQGNGLTTNVGRDGFEWVHWFSSDASAVQGVERLRQALATCSTSYAVHTVTLPSGRPVVVAAGPEVVLWFTRVASHVLVLQLPAGDTPPPDDVSVKVGDVLEHVLEQPATTTMAPGDTPPRWMQRAIAAAATFGP